jgi:hypothetical protein
MAATIFANNVGIHMIERSCLIGSMMEIMMLDTPDDITVDDQVRMRHVQDEVRVAPKSPKPGH